MFLKYRKCIDVMHYREANVNFSVFQQGMEGLEQGVVAPLFLPFFSLQQQEGRI